MNFSVTEAYSKTGYLPSKDQTPLFYRHYAVNGKKATVLLVHGFGEHSGRYSHVIDNLRKAGFEVWCIDFRGHGHSHGTRGDVDQFCRYEEDVLAGIDHALSHQNSPGKFFILAHSMGALVSLHAVTKNKLPISGMVLSCPLLALKMPVPAWKKWASIFVAKVMPEAKIKSGIRGVQLSSDHKFANAYDNDPLVLKTLSVRAFREISKGCQRAHVLAQTVTSSFFMQLGGNDPVVDKAASERWFSQIDRRAVDATLKVYPGFLHEIYNEAKREEAIGDFISWLNKRV